MKNIITILLILVSNFLVAQEIYRDTVLERQMFEQVNVYRVENGLTPFTWNDDNQTAVAWGEHLTTVQLNGLTHCLCQPGSEILADIPLDLYGNTLEMITYTIDRWDNSPMHKQQLVRPQSERAFFAAIVYEGRVNFTTNHTTKRVIFVGQFLNSEQYYLDKGWDETGGEYNHILDIHIDGKLATLK